jgi:hypothetical protein
VRAIAVVVVLGGSASMPPTTVAEATWARSRFVADASRRLRLTQYETLSTARPCRTGRTRGEDPKQ